MLGAWGVLGGTGDLGWATEASAGAAGETEEALGEGWGLETVAGARAAGAEEAEAKEAAWEAVGV